MKSFQRNIFTAAVLSSSLLLVACGGSSSSTGEVDASNPPTSATLTTPNASAPGEDIRTSPLGLASNMSRASLSSLNFVDATGQPLKNTQVEIQQNKAKIMSVASADNISVVYQGATDIHGNLVGMDLEAGDYSLVLKSGTATVKAGLKVGSDNTEEASSMAVPALIDESGEMQSLQDENGENKAIFASVSGVVYSSDGVISGAQVSLSGGSETNGVFASDVTDAKGKFFLIVNVDKSKAAALKNATIIVYADQYKTFSKIMNVADISALVGENFQLNSALGEKSKVVYEEDFNQASSGAVCGAWVTENITEGVVNLWHAHESDLKIQNQAYVENLVKLAPDDKSEGFVPEPYDGRSCWYGQGAADILETGNFLGSVNTSVQSEYNGGQSKQANGGYLISPLIDLTNETAPLAIGFKTWWEIESVNPNQNGFDLLLLDYSLDNGVTWSNIAKLNPYTDPYAEGLERAPLPFSNRGFNRAPQWLTQELIDASKLAGEQVKIRFAFQTKDNLFNGFRGWLIDNFTISREVGTLSLDTDSGPIGEHEEVLPQ